MALRDLNPDEHLRDPARKQRYVSAVFDAVAPSYDRFTRLFSFGMDAAWKRRLAAWVVDVVRSGDLAVDLACGTGDVARAIDRRLAGSGERRLRIPDDVRVIGVDPSAAMLGIARERLPRPQGAQSRAPDAPPPPTCTLLRADLMALPFADGSVAAATVAYGFRNVPDAATAAAEVARVVRPGGWLFALDFFLPEHPVWRRVFLAYLRWAGRVVGARWHRDPETYGYVARSLERWVRPAEFASLLGGVGFRVDRVVQHLGGGICLHRAVRLPGADATG